MSNIIRVDMQTLMNYAREFQNLARRLFNVQQTLSSLYNQTHIVGLGTIANRRTVSQCGEIMINCSNWCLDTFQEFQKVESFLVQQNPENFERPSKMVIDEYNANSVSSMMMGGLRDTGSILGAVGKAADDESLKGTGKVLGYFGQVGKVVNGEGNLEENIRDYVGLLGKTPGMLNLVYENQLKKLQGWQEDLSKIDPNSEAGKFISKYGDDMKVLEGLGTTIGTASSLWESAYGKDVSDFLLDCPDTTDAAVFYAKALQKKFPKKITGDAKMLDGKCEAIGAIFSMGTTATGDIMKACEDGNYTVDEVGDTCLRTGLSGASSLASAYTFGLIDIDTDKAVNTFQDNITLAQDTIYAITDNKVLQVGSAVIAVPIVTVVSTLEVIGDTVIDTKEKVVNFGNNIYSGIMSWFS